MYYRKENMIFCDDSYEIVFSGIALQECAGVIGDSYQYRTQYIS
jgi:hypothetical protein